MPVSWLAPELHEQRRHKGLGTYTTTPVRKGAVLAVFGGDVMSRAAMDAAPSDRRRNSVQVAPGLYLTPSIVGPGDHINHSCDPNAGISGQIVLVAMREIAAGEEVCYDYAMTDSSNYDEFECRCGTSLCRGRISGNDWKLRTLRRRYRGYFAPHLRAGPK